jgi:hypothetical protein
MMTNETTMAVVVDADGHFGDVATVWYVGTVKQCRNFAKTGGCRILVGCEHEKGDKIKRGELNDMIQSGAWKVVS